MSTDSLRGPHLCVVLWLVGWSHAAEIITEPGMDLDQDHHLINTETQSVMYEENGVLLCCILLKVIEQEPNLIWQTRGDILCQTVVSSQRCGKGSAGRSRKLGLPG